MLSITAQQAKEWGDAYDLTLRSDDPRLRRAVQIVMEDGSTLFYRDAFLIKRGDYIHWFTEHYGCGFQHSDEIYGYLEFIPYYEVEEIE